MLLIDKSNTFKIINNLNYDQEKVVNLNQIHYLDQEYNFNGKSKANIFDNYIVDYVKNGFKVNDFKDLVQGIDYQISVQGINGQQVTINDQELEKWLEKVKNQQHAELKITIYALNKSSKATGNISYKLINNSQKEIAKEKPNQISKQTDINLKDKAKNFFSKPQNLFFISLIPCGIIGTFFTWIFIKNRFNKKIGGRKTSKKRKKIQ